MPMPSTIEASAASMSSSNRLLLREVDERERQTESQSRHREHADNDAGAAADHDDVEHTVPSVAYRTNERAERRSLSAIAEQESGAAIKVRQE